uniref:peptidylprolyl isomerase n=1 Tax=Zooxanthella nutricula TaxID=1333877 RepID=A0A6V0KDS2_9DINO|mmetsp:Transcript_25686/g.77310  ORF Transcript_25686/g.77310 Transcript_25686/m.77310 type:complete len:177 (+) Transcript_25686:120-650(+)
MALLPMGAMRRHAPAEEPEPPWPAPPAEPEGFMACIDGVLKAVGLRDPNAAFLAERAEEPGYTAVSSGLIYKVIRKGTGKQHPSATSSCKCNFEGRLLNGKVFDASENPQTFEVGSVVKGWSEALQLMVEGDKFELILPPALGYRDRDIKGESGEVLIPPNSILLFRMELLRICSA